jgi:lambda repressor-like predicted transcriptional regulator
MHQIRRDTPIAITASETLYHSVRAALVARGSSLNAWCRANGVNRQTAERALLGHRNGKRAIALRERICAEILLPEVLR